MPPKSPAAATLKAMRNEAGLTVRALADNLGMAHSTYASYEDKYKRPYLPVELVQKLAPILAARGIPAEAVLRLGGIEQQRRAKVGENLPMFSIETTAAAMATIAELDVRGAAGGGIMDDGDTPQIVYEWRMPTDLLRGATYSPPSRVKIITVVGDSMEGTFRPFERVMVDTDDITPTPPGIFVVFDGLGLVVKRVEFVPHSDPPRVRIMSDNPRYTPYERTLNEAYIQGRVLGRWQWV